MNQRSPAPQSATELQAVVTLRAARDVARDIEDLRNQLKDDNLPPRRRQQLKDALLEAAERLCNLMDLLLSWLSMVSAGVREPLSTGIQDLRDRLLTTGVRLIGDKAQRLIDEATLAADLKEGFPLGISFRLADAVASLNSTVEVLGGFDSMPDELQAQLSHCDELIHHLRLMEEDFSFSQEFVDMDEDMVPPSP